MKLAKKFAAIAACLAIATASMGIVSSAANVNETFSRPSDFLTYSANFRGDYSVFTAAPIYGALASSNANYNGSSKYVFYATYKTSASGQSQTQYANTEWSTAQPVICYISSSPDAATSSRIYQGRLYKTSSNGSSVVDSYFINIKK